jgi:hypothetical protein
MTETNDNNDDSTSNGNMNNENNQGQQSGQSERRNRDHRSDNRHHNQNVGSNDKNWQGSKTDIGVVLGLKTEKLVYKRTFEVFKDRLSTYVLSEFSNAKDILPVLKKMIDPMNMFKLNNTPVELSDEDSKKSVEQAMQTHRIKLYIAREMNLKDNMDKLYGIVTGQCSHALLSILENDEEFIDRDERCDILWLLKKLKEITSGLDIKSNKRSNLHDALITFVKTEQYSHESDDDYMKRFKASVETLISAGGRQVLCSTEIMEKKGQTPTVAEKLTEEEKFKAICFLKQSDKNRHGALLRDLQNGAYVGRDEYPTTPAGAYDLMIRRSGVFYGRSSGGRGRGGRFGRGGGRGGRGGYNFAQHGRGDHHREVPPEDAVLVPGIDGSTIPMRCYHCNDWGHGSRNCPKRNNQSGVNAVQVGIGLSQVHGGIPSSWILLDTCSTASVACNGDLLSDIQPCSPDDSLTIYTNGGSQHFDSKGKLNMLPVDVHFNGGSMANILSMKDVVSLPSVKVTMDSMKERALLVEFQERVYKFQECANGLYYYDTNNSDKPKPEVTNYSCLQTVKDNKEYFTRQEIKGAEAARTLQQEIGWPSTSTFKTIISKNLIQNSGITVDDIHRAEIIFGTPTPLLKGKMVRRLPIQNKIEKIQLPIPIADRHKKINLYLDFFFVNGYAFLHSKSSKINFLTSQICSSRSQGQIIKVLESIKQTYEARGFDIVGVHGDNEFDIKSVKNYLLPAMLHIYGKDEHVGIIERSVRTIKERCRTMTHSMPYKKIPKIMVVAMVECATLWLNAFPSSNGVSDTMSPSTIVQGKPNPDMNHKRIVHGSYAMVYIGTKNNMTRRSVPAIALNPSNMHGGHYFMSLYSGKRLHSYEWDELPIDDDVISRVEELGDIEDAPVMADGYPMFEWAPGEAIIDELEDIQDVNVINDLPQENNVEQQLENEQENDYIEEHVHDIDQNAVDPVVDEVLESDHASSDDEVEIIDEHITNDNDLAEAHDIIEIVDEEEETNQTDEVMNEGNIVDEDVETNANGRPRRAAAGAGVERLEMSFGGKEYASVNNHQFLMTQDHSINKDIKPMGKSSYHRIAVDACFAQVARYSQMSAKAGIKEFGERAVAAMFKEFKQLNEGAVPGKPVFGQQDANELTYEEKKKALEAVNLIKEKRNGIIKGRTCADGSKQKRYLKRGETISSPTVSTEALMGTLAIDIKEGRDIAIFDVPGAYLQAEMPKDKKVLMKLRGQFVDIMCEVNPEYIPYVIEEKGEKVLYLKVLQAIYGCIESALLWYNLFATTLQGMGFEINPYDRCVANKMINGKQCTIAWYVDDNKISHVDKDVVTKILDDVKDHFGELVLSRGDKHTLLGMHITMNREKKQVEIEMVDQLKEAIKLFGEEVDDRVTSPATKSLFLVNEKCEQLDEAKSEIFHSVVAKLLFIMKRARPDLEPTISFLMKRVSKSDTDDWKKLKRCLGFIQGTIDDRRILGADSLDTLYTWVDASHAVHMNMRGHTGGIISMGTGMLHCKSSTQKINTKSTTESELVGVSEYLPYDIWYILFFGAQGYKIRQNILFQDNESAIKMEKNGRNSCTGNSRHIDIKYFWVKDRVDKKEVEVKYCPTKLMLADYFTKALQGSLFRMFRDIIMGYTHIDTILLDPSYPLKERVENTDKNRKVSEDEESIETRGTTKNVTYADIVKKGKLSNDNIDSKKSK